MKVSRRQTVRFRLSKKLVAQVRYYETMWLIDDRNGTRVFTGSDEKVARTILATLNRAYPAQAKKKVLTRKPKRARKAGKHREARKSR